MRRSFTAQAGQTAAEYVGVLLVVATIIAALASSDLGGEITRATGRQVCLIAGEDAKCPLSNAERAKRAKDRRLAAARHDTDGDYVPDVVERRHGTNPRAKDSDRDGESDARALRRSLGTDPVAQAAWAKRAACIAAQGLAVTIDAATGTPIASALAEGICDGLKKAVNGLEKAVAPVIRQVCNRRATATYEPINICKQVIDKACWVLNKVDRRSCDAIKRAACFATELDLFCTKSNKQKKLDKRNAELRTEAKIDTPGGSMRIFGRDRFNRATGARADVSPETIAHRRKFDREGEASTRDVPGLDRYPCFQASHLVGRILGGPGAERRNLVALPPDVNGRDMAALEKQIAEAAAAGRVLKVDVRAFYGADNDPIPTRVVMSVKTVRAQPGLKDFTLTPAQGTLTVKRPLKCP